MSLRLRALTCFLTSWCLKFNHTLLPFWYETVRVRAAMLAAIRLQYINNARRFGMSHSKLSVVSRKENKAFSREFIQFVLVSGVGWLLDIASYAILHHAFNVSPSAANFISSYVGVTFAYFASLQVVFASGKDGRLAYLYAYWVWQFFSISFYSIIIANVHGFLVNADLSIEHSYSAILAKIIITPFNLLSNFLFMKILVLLMNKGKNSG